MFLDNYSNLYLSRVILNSSSASFFNKPEKRLVHKIITLSEICAFESSWSRIVFYAGFATNALDDLFIENINQYAKEWVSKCMI